MREREGEREREGGREGEEGGRGGREGGREREREVRFTVTLSLVHCLCTVPPSSIAQVVSCMAAPRVSMALIACLWRHVYKTNL